MKTLTTFCFAILALGFCNAQIIIYTPEIVQTNYDLAYHDLKGNVKSMDRLDGILMKNFSEDKLLKRNSHFFNEDGLLTKSLLYARDPAIPIRLSFENRYDYDNKGNLLQQQAIMGEQKSTMTYSYAADGRLQELSHTDYDETTPSSKTTYTYNSETHTTTVKEYASNKLEKQSKITEDAAGRITQIIRYECWDGKCNEDITAEYGYDAQGNLILDKTSGNYVSRIKYHYKDNRIIKKESQFYEGDVAQPLKIETVEYDAQGNMSKISFFSGEEHTRSEEYEYDAQGNWIKLITHFHSGGVALVVVRKITYY